MSASSVQVTKAMFEQLPPGPL